MMETIIAALAVLGALIGIGYSMWKTLAGKEGCAGCSTCDFSLDKFSADTDQQEAPPGPEPSAADNRLEKYFRDN